MDIRKKIIKIASNILADINFGTQKEFEEYIKNHPNYREDTKFFVDGMQVSAPPREKNNDSSEMSDKQKKLHQMAINGDDEDKSYVAMYEDTHPTTLDRLSRDENGDVRMSVAENQNTSPKTLDRLSGDEDLGVRFYVALNKNTSPKTLDRLSGDEDLGVRIGVAKNKNTPSKILEKLSKDRNKGVRYFAKKNLYLKS